MEKIKVFYGLPGTGKTTALINEIKKHIANGYQLEDVCFCTYRKQMAKEIRDRISEEFNLSEDEAKETLFYYRTIHGVSKRIGEDDVNVAKTKDKIEFFNSIGYQITELEDGTKNIGSQFFTVRSWLVANDRPIRDCIHYPDLATSLLFSRELFSGLNNKWRTWKHENELIDYDDMLLYVLEHEIAPPTKILVVDEFQDINPLQYKIYCIWRDNAEHVIIGGDPNQCIYGFQGSSPRFFLGENDKRVVLDRSFRLSSASWRFAKKIIDRNGGIDNVDVPDIGSCDGGFNPAFVNRIRGNLDLGCKTFILARCNYVCAAVRSELQDMGVPYVGVRGWSEKEKNVYNCILKLRGASDSVSCDELAAFLMCFRKKYVKVKKKNLKHDLPNESCINSAKRYLSGLFVDDILNNPFKSEYLVRSWFSLKQVDKISKALNKYGKLFLGGVVHVGTIHSVKGGECDDTFLIGNLTKRIVDGMYNSQSCTAEENRVFFVGATRHKRKLFIIEDYLRTGLIYGFPRS